MPDDDDFNERMDIARELLGGKGTSVVHGWVTANTLYARYQDAFGIPTGIGDEDLGTGFTGPSTDMPEAYFGTPAQRMATGYEGPNIMASTFKHFNGGHVGYLSAAIDEGAPAMEDFVDGLCSIFEVGDDSVCVQDVFDEVIEFLIDTIATEAPVESGDLRMSAGGKGWVE